MIPIIQARALFTQALVAFYKDMPRATSFLQSFFKAEEFGTKYLTIAVKRGTEKIAVDVLRGADGNRNTFSYGTEKGFLPPLYNEFFDATQLDLYDRLFTASGNIDEADLAAYIREIAEKLFALEEKIKRAIELQCAQVLLTGIVQLKNGDNIDYKRKATSLVDLSSTPWTSDSNNPLSHIAAGAEWIRKNGKVQGGNFDIIMGKSAKAAFSNNEFIEKTANFRRIDNIDVGRPQRNAVGGVTHGQFSAGDYNFTLWTYPEFYQNSSNVMTPYLDEKKIIILPENTDFNLSFAAVPQLIVGADGRAISSTKGAFVAYDHVDERKSTHDFGLKSAPLAIPTAVDTIYTAQVVA